MKAIVQNAIGEPADVLQLIELEDPKPKAGEVLIEVKLAPIHHGDLQLTRAQASIPEDIGHIRRGAEAVGAVLALGSDVEGQGHLKIGDRVIGFPATGSWAERVIVPAFAAIPVPPEVSDSIAAQLLINYVTARMILRALHKSIANDALRDGAVLVTGAGAVVARLLLHALIKDGIRPIGLARSASSAKRVTTELAGVQVTATEDAEWREQVTSLAAGRKIVAVLDCVSGSLIRDVASLTADDAVIVTYGALGGDPSGVGLAELIGRQLINRGVVFTRWFTELTRGEQVADIQSAFEVATELPSLFTVDTVERLADFGKAVAAVEATNRNGFVLLKPSPSACSIWVEGDGRARLRSSGV